MWLQLHARATAALTRMHPPRAAAPKGSCPLTSLHSRKGCVCIQSNALPQIQIGQGHEPLQPCNVGQTSTNLECAVRQTAHSNTCRAKTVGGRCPAVETPCLYALGCEGNEREAAAAAAVCWDIYRAVPVPTTPATAGRDSAVQHPTNWPDPSINPMVHTHHTPSCTHPAHPCVLAHPS